MNPFTPEQLQRRLFLSKLSLPIITIAASPDGQVASRQSSTVGDPRPALKLSLNAYSFNKELLNGTMSLEDLLTFCAEQGLMAVDITGYYFKGYPKVPSDDVIYRVKRKAFELGLEICGTGVRNDFTHADAGTRGQHVQLVKDWIEVSQKLGGQTLRIFSGTQTPAGYTRQQMLNWILDDIRECVEHGEKHGIVVALQNHDDFIKTADDTIQIMDAIRSPWLGLMLDIGSYRTGDPYEEIAKTIKYAVTWQIKEKVYERGKEVDVNADRLIHLITNSGFRGYLPLETLGEGDPKKKISLLHEKFKRALNIN